MKFFGYIKDFESILHHDIIKRGKTTPFLVFIFLLLSFIFERLYSLVYPYLKISVIIKDYHIHHFFFGVIFISIACWIALVTNKFRMMRIAAILFGIGLGLVIDEWGLLVTCGSEGIGCDYWHRMSYDVLVIVSTLLLLIIYFGPFWDKIGKKVIYRVLKPFGVSQRKSAKK